MVEVSYNCGSDPDPCRPFLNKVGEAERDSDLRLKTDRHVLMVELGRGCLVDCSASHRQRELVGSRQPPTRNGVSNCERYQFRRVKFNPPSPRLSPPIPNRFPPPYWPNHYSELSEIDASVLRLSPDIHPHLTQTELESIPPCGMPVFLLGSIHAGIRPQTTR